MTRRKCRQNPLGILWHADMGLLNGRILDTLARAMLRKAFLILIFSVAGILAETSAPVITGGLGPQRVVFEGEIARFEVTAMSDEPIGYRWYSPGPILAGGDSWIETRLDKMSFNPQYVSVRVFNRHGSVTRDCLITGYPKDWLKTWDTNVFAVVGQPVSIGPHVVVGEGATNLWFKNGIALGQTNWNLTFSPAQLEDAGIYTLKSVYEPGQLPTDPIRLTVLISNSPPYIADPLSELHLISGETQTMHIQTWSIAPAQVFIRRQNGEIQASENGDFEIAAANGTIEFFVTNAFGAATSRVCNVVAHAPSDRIIFAGDEMSVAPFSHDERFELQSALLQGVDVDLQWYLNSAPVPGEKSLRLSAAGWWPALVSLVASNKVGAATQFFDLKFKPRFYTPTVGYVARAAGETITVTARGDWNTIQWYRNGTPIPGATNSSVAMVVDETTVGTYHAVIRNPYGEAIGNQATVAIRPAGDVRQDYRLVTRDSFPVGGVKDGAVTYFIGTRIFRWQQGTQQTIVNSDTVIEGLPPDWRSIQNCREDGNGTLAFIAGKSSFDMTPAALVVKDATGFRVIAKTGDAIPGSNTRGIVSVGSMAIASGKIAFMVNDTADQVSLLVWDGASLQKWIDSTNPELAAWSGGALEGKFGFDGTNAVLRGAFRQYPTTFSPWLWNSGVFRVNAIGEIQKIIWQYDPIPGTDKSLAFLGARVASQGEKSLFLAGYSTATGSSDDSSSAYLVEHAPGRDPEMRVIAGPGSLVEGGLSIHWVQPNFSYSPNGDILFWAIAGTYREKGSPVRRDLEGVFRWSKGKITEEITGRDRIAGRETSFVRLAGELDEDYVIATGVGTYTTAPGSLRPSNTVLQLSKSGDNVTAQWSGDGWLQATDDFVDWTDIATEPGSTSIGLTNRSAFFRIYYP